MRKVIAIGQSSLDIIHIDGKPAASFTGGRIANMAASLARLGHQVEYVSECANDSVGDMIVDFLKTNGVGVASVDRYTDGLSQVSLIFSNSDGKTSYSEYRKYPTNRFNVLWPRIEEDDIVVFGAYFAIEEDVRKPLLELLNYAVERKAIIVYLPGFQPELCSRITRVMPSIHENLEFADFVLARESDMKKIYEKEDSLRCYNDHILFYCPNFLFVANDFNVTMHAPKGEFRQEYKGEKPKNQLGWHATFCAGIVHGLLKHDILRSTLNEVNAETWTDIVQTALACAADSSHTHRNTVSDEIVNKLK